MERASVEQSPGPRHSVVYLKTRELPPSRLIRTSASSTGSLQQRARYYNRMAGEDSAGSRLRFGGAFRRIRGLITALVTNNFQQDPSPFIIRFVCNQASSSGTWRPCPTSAGSRPPTILSA